MAENGKRHLGKWFLPLAGLGALVWFLVRVLPKPSRAAYPCMRVAAPVASGFIVWLLSLGLSVVVLRKAFKSIQTSRSLKIALGVTAALVFCLISIPAGQNTLVSANLPSESLLEITADPVNDPIGVPRGSNPGRVVWVHDPAVTDWEGPTSGESCWEPGSIDQVVVDRMMSEAIRWLGGAASDAQAWDALFRYINVRRGLENRGYQTPEKIAIKLNLTLCYVSGSPNPESRVLNRYLDKAGNTNPQMVLALLRQLVYEAGVDPENIYVGDPVTFFPEQWYEYLTPEFSGVHFLDHYQDSGLTRTKVQFSETRLYWSTADADNAEEDFLPVSFADSDYFINFSVLKSHSMGGITVSAKNHYGSLIRSPPGNLESTLNPNYYHLHDSLPCGVDPGRGKYRALVDLMGHADLGGKTLLYLIDALIGGKGWDGDPYKWNMPPFNGQWPSSLLASQDPVAIDSVAYDFLVAEWPQDVEDADCGEGGAQDYLHEAALAGNPPSGTFYDPENDSQAMASQGVHEHWNNPNDRQYSRNLGASNGIELISSDPLTCIGDFDSDRDVDGYDLSKLANGEQSLDLLDEVAREFGRLDCL